MIALSATIEIEVENDGELEDLEVEVEAESETAEGAAADLKKAIEAVQAEFKVPEDPS
jgi:hypothetical protein